MAQDRLALRTAIFALLGGTDLNTAISGRMVHNKAPDSWVMPYVVFDIPDGNKVDLVYEADIIKFHIFSASSNADEVDDIYKKLRAVYDDAALTAGSVAENTSLDWENCICVHEKDNWHYVVSYRTWIRTT